MIVVDTSALIAILAAEPEGFLCEAVLRRETYRLISAATLAEALIVARRRGIGWEMDQLWRGLELEVVPVTAEIARDAAEAYDRWGKGIHPAALNLMDVFSYALARSRGCALLYVGNDFAQTDVPSALPE